jgi:hypothetical protein
MAEFGTDDVETCGSDTSVIQLAGSDQNIL